MIIEYVQIAVAGIRLKWSYYVYLGKLYQVIVIIAEILGIKYSGKKNKSISR